MQAIADKGQVKGRVDSPIIKAAPTLPSGKPFDLLSCCSQQLQMMFAMYEQNATIVRELQRQSDSTIESAIRKLMIPTVDSVPFLVPSGVLNIATAISSGAFVTVCEVLINEGYDGILETVGVAAFPSTGLDGLVWTVRISGDAAPKFSSSKFSDNTLATPLPFRMYAPPGRTIQLQVRNDGASAISVAGVITGFSRPARGIGGA
jgi:hypothetical protein